jgi:hypothetical protein
MKIGEFEWMFPCYALAEKDSLERMTGPNREDKKPSLLSVSVNDGQLALLLFTDEDLARRFCEECKPIAAQTLIKITDERLLLKCLCLSESQYPFVLVDANPQIQVGAAIPIHSFLVQVAREVQGQPDQQ